MSRKDIRTQGRIMKTFFEGKITAGHAVIIMKRETAVSKAKAINIMTSAVAIRDE